MFVDLKFIEEFNGVPKNFVLPPGKKLALERKFDVFRFFILQVQTQISWNFYYCRCLKYGGLDETSKYLLRFLFAIYSRFYCIDIEKK